MPLPAGALRERRLRRRRIFRNTFLALLLLLIAGAFYLAWRPGFRIETVTASGPGSDVSKQIVLTDIGGTYLHILPRNSIFFYPQGKIRAAILDSIPETAAVSLQRDSFSSIHVTAIPREESFLWCGTSIDTPDPNGCYDADAEGFIFKPDAGSADSGMASSTASTTMPSSARGEVRIFAPLDRDISNGESPIRAHVVSASYLPNALKFVDAVRTLGAPVSALALRGDEADLWLGAKTRITYVLGQEREAADVAASALPTLNLADGSIQYVDLRFPGKAYVKKYGQ